MGDRGPVGKRDAERQRRNAPDIPVEKLDITDILKAEVSMPPVNEDWHPVARRWYESLGESAQSMYYEPTDWAVAYMTAESISRDLESQFVGFTEDGEGGTKPEFAKIPLKGASLSAYIKVFGALLMTEGDRRRMKLEITRSVGTSAAQVESETADLAARREDAVGNG